MGLISSKPGSASIAGLESSVMVSPIFVSPTFFMLAMKKPTSPARSSPISTGLGVNTPTVSTSKVSPFDIRRILPSLGADQDRIRCVQAHCALDHFLGTRNVGARQVNLVDDRNNLEPIVDRQIRIRQS